MQDEDHPDEENGALRSSVGSQSPSAEEAVPRQRGRLAKLAAPRGLARIAYRDPLHICERLSLFAAQRLAEPSRQWAEESTRKPDADLNEIVTDLGIQSAKIARLQGLVAGTPFYLALVPGYINYLWQEMRITLRLAALYGRDPASLRTAAEMLAMRGLHQDFDMAEAALLAIQNSGPPPKPEQRRPLRLWIESGRRLLVFGGFLSPPSGEPRSGWLTYLRDALGVVVGVVMWVVTWVFPVTFMIMMAWGCETHARRLFGQAAEHYAGSEAPAKLPIRPGQVHHNRPQGTREIVSAAGVALSIAIPIGFLAYADHVRNKTGITWVSALGFLVAASLVIAAAVYGSRR